MAEGVRGLYKLMAADVLERSFWFIRALLWFRNELWKLLWLRVSGFGI